MQGCSVSLKTVGIIQGMCVRDSIGRSLRLTVTSEVLGGTALKVTMVTSLNCMSQCIGGNRGTALKVTMVTPLNCMSQCIGGNRGTVLKVTPLNCMSQCIGGNRGTALKVTPLSYRGIVTMYRAFIIVSITYCIVTTTAGVHIVCVLAGESHGTAAGVQTVWGGERGGGAVGGA